jgi:hypothetical protein
MYALLCKPMILPPPSPQSSDVMMMGVKTCRIVVIQPSQKENVYELTIEENVPPLIID